MLLNHFPIIGTLIGCGLLTWGIIKRQANLKVAASATLLLMAIIAIPVYLTGEPAEEAVEELAGVSESLIKLHEDAATWAIWLMGIAGLSALIALVLKAKDAKRTDAAFMATLLIGLFSFAAMARTGYLGGQIRHSEIRANATATVNTDKNEAEGKATKDSTKKTKEGEEKDEDDK